MRERDRKPARGRARGGEKKLSRQEATERLATVVVVPAAAGWWWFAVTQWWNGGTKDTTVRRKRVVMGRESRCVLLLVALAVLAAADAFSTDSKSALLCEKREATFADGDSERKGCARMEGKGGEG